MSDSVLLSIENDIATVTMNRPDVHNAFDQDMIRTLYDCFENLAARDDIAAVILRGAGKSFSAGADANWMKEAAGYTVEQNKEDALKLAVMLYRLYSLPKFTIACVQGAAMGGGLGLVSACDCVIATDQALFALSEVKLGLIPATISPYVIQAIGARQSLRYFQTGERFNADKAYDIGLVHERVADDKEMHRTLEKILKGLERNGLHAMAQSKKLCHDLAGLKMDQALMRDTADRIADIRAGEEAKEGLAAFIEKRSPSWTREKG